ncbi:tRNA 2-selenouridine synthase [Scopulibacillus darangshiensis]|uniref:tRNA 2-selenouridine synthase n=1 Tax=Scopulibacillus darangshiensis TaxID=442528 RepID=A0A4R2P7I5_9BACL|nr:tRNA 2-selenouridine(34) synthase MnmH [Scopulibacillus darangshiensis]TCP30228.1 tRNA 2-selenouridine synthase [Scopulibacillus darangshiensis]
MDVVKKISIDEVIDKSDQIGLIDVRSPGEFKAFHIPGAINVPLFSNDERARIGTLYKQKGPHIAKDEGLKIVSPKLPHMFETIRKHAKAYDQTVIYCWRGGMRSLSVASIMNLMGCYTLQLDGGIRSFRKRIVGDLEAFAQEEKPYVVVEGLTGSRKTDILLSLKEKGYPVLDLEGMAGHRGSIFGSVGLEPNSQKGFECMLWLRLRELSDASYYMIEAESKRIGRVVLPEFIINGKENGTRFHIHYPFQKRVQAIYEAYEPTRNEGAVYEAFIKLRKHLNPAFAEEVEDAYQQKDYYKIISLFLEHYYDPKYSHKFKDYKSDAISLTVSSVVEGVARLEEELGKMVMVPKE